MNDALWAPWRIDYIRTVTDGGTGCFLCEAATMPQSDAPHLVLARNSRCILMMNKFPYVNGHLLVAPYQHAADLSQLSTDTHSSMMELVVMGQQLLAEAMNPQGFNIGLNIGRCAGAGVPGHVHMHIVPRWNGDVNFMSVTGNVRVIPQALTEAYKALLAAAAKVLPAGTAQALKLNLPTE